MLKQSLVWSKGVGKLDDNLDKIYIINQVMMYGNLEDIAQLKNVYGEDEVKRIFVENPMQIYSKSSFNFAKKFVLKIDQNLDVGRYIKSVY